VAALYPHALSQIVHPAVTAPSHSGRNLARVAKTTTRLAWLLPLVLFSENALAWGLYTHVYFAQLLIWAIPLADPRFRRAVGRFPELLLTGVCLPDLALFGRHVGAPVLGSTHQWSVARRLLGGSDSDESRALALGYASHLLTDVIAHNHFVPAHEQLWLDRPVVTHAASEWTMDAFVAPHLFARPAELMTRHRVVLAEYTATQFHCAPAAARRALDCLRRGDALLRGSGLPQALLRAARGFDGRLPQRFRWYIAETAARLGQVNRLIEGDAPVWHAEVEKTGTTHGPARRLAPVMLKSPLPQDFF
jgi:hypothetical protein